MQPLNATSESFPCRLCACAVLPRRWGGAECQRCGSVSMKTLPSNEEIAAFYQTYNDNYTGGGSSQGRNLERYAQRYMRLVRRFGASNGRLIDIGSSNNPFPDLAAQGGYETTAMDFVKPARLSPGVKFVQGSINETSALKLGPNHFDVVTCWAVLEHLPNPHLSASVLAGLCRPGGTILLSTPEVGTALTRHSLGRSPWFYPPEHLSLVSPEAVKLLFEQRGCTLVERGRLELTPLRYLVRYGVGVVESSVGRAVRLVARRAWNHWRDERVQSFQGVCYFVLRKADAH